MVTYRLQRKLATGGMAEVFLGKVLGAGGFEKPVAIKRILPQLAEDPAFTQQFVAEGRLTVTLQHANVVQVLDLGRSGNSWSMVLEYIDGDTLLAVLRAARMQQRTVLPREAAWIALQVAEGLAYAHARKDERGQPMNIVHRDVTPSNVMISTNGEVKLSDFGIARAASAHSHTAAGVVKGKTGYFAPEQVKGAQADQRTDVFCLGILLWELLHGQRLFREKELPRAFAEVHAFRPEAMPLTGVPPRLAQVLRCALAREPADRYPNARGFADAVSQWLFEDHQRVGAADIQKLFADLFPGRRSPLELPHDLDECVQLGAAAFGPATAVGNGATHEAKLATPALGRRRLKPHEQRLADLALATDLLTPEELKAALEVHQGANDQSLTDVLVRSGVIDAQALLPVMAEVLGVKYLSDKKLREVPAPEQALKRVSVDQAEKFSAVPIAMPSAGQLVLAMANPTDLTALDALKFMTGATSVTAVLATAEGVKRTIARFYRATPDLEESWDTDPARNVTPGWSLPYADPDQAALPLAARLRDRLLDSMLARLDPSGGAASAAQLAGLLVAKHPRRSAHEAERAQLLTQVLCLAALEASDSVFAPPGGAVVRRMLGTLWDELETELEPSLREGFGTVAPRGAVAESVMATLGLMYLARVPAPRGEAAATALSALRRLNLLSELTVGAVAEQVSLWQRATGLLAVLALAPGPDVVSLQVRLLESGWKVRSPAAGELLSGLTDATVVIADEAACPGGFAALAAALHAQPTDKRAALLAVATDAQDPLMATAMDLGADDVLLRPLNTSMVLSKLKRLVGARAPVPSAPRPIAPERQSGRATRLSRSRWSAASAAAPVRSERSARRGAPQQL